MYRFILRGKHMCSSLGHPIQTNIRETKVYESMFLVRGANENASSSKTCYY